MKRFSELGIHVPEILLPAALDTGTWPVIACDQYTQDRRYWEEVAARVGARPSALRVIFPEVYLNDGGRNERIEAVRNAMREYLSSSVFAPPRRGFVYVERKTAYGRTRKGLVAAIDLEAYEWKPFSTALVRATEATIVGRIPPRMEIRRGAPLELPHIMLLADDASKTFVEAVGARAKASGADVLYDGALMMNGGSISGWAVDSPELLESARGALERLAAEHQAADGSTFLFAVGDGNHSLATAKAVWEERKAERIAAGASAGELADDPVRYALVEIVNIYDDGLTFEPIHRVFFHADAGVLVEWLAGRLGGRTERIADAESLERRVKESSADFGFAFRKDGAPEYILLRTAV
ncbi:MAG: DUF1015 domain-containing protein, partial [Treponemataceae bacterium]|nr:DUF1015 domain-containing protein [Treponemataceae bacterium]